MTIKQEMSDTIRGPIVGREKRISRFALLPMAIPGLGSAPAALRPGWLARNPGLTPGVAQGVTSGLTWARAAVDALGAIGLPAAVLFTSHRLAAANALLERLIPEVVRDRSPRFGLADSRADAMLGEALQRLRDDPCGEARAIPLVATRHRPASIVHIFVARGAGATSCVVVITAIARPRIASAQLLQDLFDLTPAEARVARGIAAGKTIRGIADEAGLAAGTVRQQLKSAFGKTGVSRQADLVGLLVGSGLGFPATMSIADHA